MVVNEGIRAEAILNCPFCKTGGDLFYNGLRDRLFGTPGSWNFNRCKNCDLIWLDPRPVSEDFSKLYENYGFPLKENWTYFLRMKLKKALLLSVDGSLQENRLPRYFGNLLRSFPPLRDREEVWQMHLGRMPKGRLLDVGCGEGRFLDLMRMLGWEVHGLEVNPRIASRAQKLELDISIGTFDEVKLPENHFDAITLSHVIEHVHDPQGFMAKCYDLLKPGGKLVMLTPNRDSFGHRYLKERWRELDPPRHFYIFPASILRYNAERVGFEIEQLKSYSRMAGFIYAHSEKLYLSAKGFPIPTWMLRIVGFVFGTLEYFAKNLMGRLYGEEILLVGRKPSNLFPSGRCDSSSLGAPRVASITVSYNNWSALRNHIESLLSQSRPLQEIIVVDNASSDETGGMIRAVFGERITFIPLRENTGISGGFKTGLEYAYKAGHDWIWLFDQDSIAMPDALEELFKARRAIQPGDPIGVLSSLAICKETGVTYDGRLWKDRIKKIPACWLSQPVYFADTVISSGSLIRRDVIEKVGYPKEEFFIDFVDHEYNLRIRRTGFRIAVVTKSIIRHAIGNPKMIRRFGYSRVCYRHPSWREYYKSRNETYTFWHQFPGFRQKLYTVSNLIRRVIGTFIFEDRRLVRIKLILLGFWHGINGTLGITLKPRR